MGNFYRFAHRSEKGYTIFMWVNMRWLLPCAIVGVMGLFIAAPLFGFGEIEIVDPPTDERENYRVGFVEFRVDQLNGEFDYLRWSLPLLLYENTIRIEQHRLADDEIAAYRMTLLDRARATEGAALDSALESRDVLLFTENPSSAFARTREQAEENVTKARTRAAMVQAMSPEQIEVAAEKPIERRSGDQQRVLSRDGRTLGEIARQEDLDLLITGSIDQVGEFIFVETELYNTLTERRESSSQLVGSFEEVGALFVEIQDRIAEVLIGGKFASVTIQGIKDDTKIYIDDRLYGYGEQTISYIQPGSHNVRVASSTGQERTQTLFSIPGLQQTIYLSLPQPSTETVRVETSPPGAAVYVNSIWSGYTPIDVPQPTEPSTLVIRKQNFYDARQDLFPEDDAVIFHRLRPAIVDLDERLIVERDQFYGALGLFVISIPVALLITGLAENIVNYYDARTGIPVSTASNRNTLNEAAALQTVQGVSLFISGTLLVNTIIELVEYIGVADRYHGQ